ncbi:hypothetical protein MARCHEWKA_01350 [Brevundimonas phage vB_BpoS-Marchewka]|uniref:Uncharacterized protein n=1 Tax=Brevundimonas phage vB_BpoS-Marchewka TaxID=2948604 RepID=A0A9E7N4H9_9CAUD|nr:hypothetical protein MARCHEWKA_01350 [Brevundimonas phage vB_BpoS-Marchewka]
MRDAYQITITLDVTDPRQLFDAALQRYHAENPGTPVGVPDAYSDYIGTRAQPDISGCLRMLADPGVSWPGTQIDGSSAEFQASNDDEDGAEPQAPAFEPGAQVLFTSTCSDAITAPDTPAEVLRVLAEDEADAEVGPMYRVRTDDGAEYDAFEDELTPIS